jgi:hypothetical protein
VALRSFRQDPDARMVPLPAMSGFTRLGGGSSSGQEDGMGGADSPVGSNPLAAGGGSDRRLVVSQDEVEAARADSSRV